MVYNIKKYIFIFFLSAIFYLAYLILRPFFISIIIAALLAYIFYPIYRLFSKFNKKVSALFTILVVLLIIFLPLFFLITILIKELQGFYFYAINNFQNNYFITSLSNYLIESPLNINLKNILINLINDLLINLKNFLLNLPSKIINIFLTLFLIFFFLIDGELIIKKILEISLFTKKNTLYLLNEIKNIVNAVFYGQILTAFIQGIIAFIGFILFEYKAALLLSIILFFVSLIPMIGPSLVYIPLSIFTIIIGINTNNQNEIIKGILLLVYGLVIISSVDNIVKPFFISDQIKRHPVLIMLGILGGIFVFGIIGIIIGPVILIIIETILNIYKIKIEIT